jgi:hypothetical protein
MTRLPGENYELRADLNSEYREKRKDAIKRVIANMTVGKVPALVYPSTHLTTMAGRLRPLPRRPQEYAD